MRKETVSCDRCGYVMVYHGEEQTYRVTATLSSEASKLRAPVEFDLCGQCAGLLRQFLDDGRAKP